MPHSTTLSVLKLDPRRKTENLLEPTQNILRAMLSCYYVIYHHRHHTMSKATMYHPTPQNKNIAFNIVIKKKGSKGEGRGGEDFNILRCKIQIKVEKENWNPIYIT